MSESKTPRVDAIVERLHGSDSQPFLDFARTLELELNEALTKLESYSDDCAMMDSLRHQLTAAQQDLAKIAKALRTQQQRYHDLSEEVDGLKRDKERLAHLFSEAFLPPVGKDYVVPSGTVVMCVASDVPLDEEAYRQAIDSAILSLIPQKEKKA